MEKQFISRGDCLEKILSAYSQWYDIDRMSGEDAPFAAYAEFHEHQSGYMLVRKAEMWSADRHEYVYFFTMPHLTAEGFRSGMEEVLRRGLEKVDPVPGHMCSGIVGIFICDSADEEAVKLLKKYRWRKSFQFSLRGWAEAHTALALTGEGAVVSNAAGRNTAGLLKKLL
ncbi:MAG: hypothetical protein IJT43_11695 [Stomatobaculum sp.]|nr:hypothetical protein [Stomatobaculum sp.]